MMRVLLIGHRPGDDAATTLALAAAAALNGLGGDGRRLIDVERPPSVAQVAHEAGLRRETVRDALDVLRGEGSVAFKGGGVGRSLLVHVEPDAPRARWANYRQRCRFPVQLRRLGVRPNVMLVTGLVLGQRAANGVCEIGIDYLVERTGLARRTLERALADAVNAGALKRWLMPNGTKWPRLAVAEGPKLRPSDTRPPVADRFEDPPASTPSDSHPPGADRFPPEPGGTPSAARSHLSGTGGRTCPKLAVDQSESGGLTCPPVADEFRNHPDTRIQPGAEPASPAVETEPEQQQLTGSGTVHRLQLVPSATATTTTTPATTPRTPEQVREVVENWRIENKRFDVLNPANDMHAVAVVLLLERLGWNQPDDLHEGPARRRDARTRALRKAILADARRVIAWAGTTDTLATWILRAIAEHGPSNVCGYVQKASSAGDPGSLLHSAKRNTAGRAAETWRDYSAATEKALEGEHQGDVAKLVTAGAMVASTIDSEERRRLRAQLATFLATGRRDGARRVLLRLIGSHPNDSELGAAVAGILSLEDARRLIA